MIAPMAEEQAPWTKENITVVTIPAGIADKRITRYRADASANPPNHKRIAVAGVDSDGKSYLFDFSETEVGISEENSAMLDTAGEAAVALLLTVSGFTPPAES